MQGKLHGFQTTSNQCQPPLISDTYHYSFPRGALAVQHRPATKETLCSAQTLFPNRHTMDLDGGGDTLTTRYTDYPATKPFINTNFEREDQPVNSYPTTKRDDVISALRSLQSKMRQLEIDRRVSEQALQTLTTDTERFKEHLSNGRLTYKHVSTDAETEDQRADKHARELKDRLIDTENRCQMLGKQLEHMKTMTLKSQANGWDPRDKALLTGQDSDLRYHMDRLNELERDQARLTTTQSLAEMYSGDRTDHSESKIKELEKRLKEEKMHRKVLQEKTSQLETATVSNVRMTKDTTRPAPPRPHSSPALLTRTKKPLKKKKKKVVSNKSAPSKMEPRRHFRLNIAEIPFVAGKSTGPSHSLGANVQKVLSMMKTHNTALCSMYVNVDNPDSVDSSPSSGSSSTGGVDQDLNDLISQLQDEYGHLASENHRLLDQIHSMRDLLAREELEKEYEAVVAKMKAKREQISKIMKHQQKLAKVVKGGSTVGKHTDRPKRPHSHPCRPTSAGTNHFHGSAAKRMGVAHSHQPGVSKPKATGSTLLNPALYMLRDMKKLQTTLRRDDLSWE